MPYIRINRLMTTENNESNGENVAAAMSGSDDNYGNENMLKVMTRRRNGESENVASQPKA